MQQLTENNSGSYPPIAAVSRARHPRIMRAAHKVLAQALGTGSGAALLVGLSWLVDSNHERPAALALSQAGATFFWVTVLAAVWFFFKRRPG